jgi:hypothetical protein
MELNQPVTVTDVKIITAFEINNIEVILNTSARLFVYLKNEDKPISSEIINIEGLDYQLWGSDDTYITEFVKNYIVTKYGV